MSADVNTMRKTTHSNTFFIEVMNLPDDLVVPFKRVVATVFNDDHELKFSNFTEESFDVLDTRNILFNEFKDAFFRLPIHYGPFWERCESFTVTQMWYVLYKSPANKISNEIFMEWLEHKLTCVEKEYNFSEREKELGLITKKVVQELNKLELNKELEAIIHFSLTNQMGSLGWTDLAIDYLTNCCQSSDDVINFLGMYDQFTLVGHENSSWIDDPHISDFVISELLKSIGAKNLVESVRAICSTNDVLSASQWFDFADRFDEMNLLPPSWWKSLLCEDFRDR